MATTTFENAKRGDKVFSTKFGCGEIVYIDRDFYNHIQECSVYPIHVYFSKYGITHIFTYGGYLYEYPPYRSLFWNDITIKTPTKSVGVKVVNGVEIPNISYTPDPGEYCYVPFPDRSKLCAHLYIYSHKESEYIIYNDLCYPDTEEGRQVAIMHAKALLGIC
jgi:hypothetical protein